ncbi:MFS transporter [Kibdelosporangium aridum]|nr:MFS transporter [Kibdelosporangium aridum]
MHHGRPAVADPLVDRRWVVLSILCASLLLVSVDATVLHMALPALAADLRPTATGQLWIIAAYSLVAAPLLLAFGTLGDRHGRRRILVLGYVVFGLASLACAWAPNVPVMIAARAALGVGGAMIMPATLSLLRQAFPDRAERRTAIGVWSGIAGSGAVLGPLLGGFLVETFSWHAAFLINVPVMVAVIPLTYWLIPESADPPDGPWDVLGAALAAVGVAGVAFAVKQSPHGGSMFVLGPLAGLLGCLLLVAFVRRQRKLRVPLLEVGLFRNPAFSVAVGSVLLVLMSLVGLGLLFAQYLQLVLALEPMQAALRLLFVMAAAIIGSLVAGPLLQRFGNRLMTVTGFAVGAMALAAAAVGLTVGEGSTLIALDPSSRGTQALQQDLAGSPGARTVCVTGDGCLLPLADGMADTLFYGYSLEEMPDPVAAIREAYRVLRPGGELVLFLWRPVMNRRRRRPLIALLDTLFVRDRAAVGPQNLRLVYRKSTVDKFRRTAMIGA